MTTTHSWTGLAAAAALATAFAGSALAQTPKLTIPLTSLQTGAALKLKGEWITKEKARAHGGEKMSVLHFTHHPLGFICTPVKCYM